MRLAMIGCGAITQGQHTPAALNNKDTEIAALVDVNLSNAQRLADKYGLSAFVTADYNEIVDQVDSALVAVPHHLHAPIVLDLLKHGLNVLVEKPMAITTQDCDRMMQAAQDAPGGPAVLAIGHVRRYYYNSLYVYEALQHGLLGQIESFDCREGTSHRWAQGSGSNFRFDKRRAGGGVLADIGIHVLDLLLWWFGDYGREPDPQGGVGSPALRYYDDDMGGVEADCLLEIEMAAGMSGTIELSRTRDLRNTWIIRGERGILEVGTAPNASIQLQLDGQTTTLTGVATQGGVPDDRFVYIFGRQFDDFCQAVKTGGQPLISGREGRRVIDLMETCYAHRQPLPQPWLLPTLPMPRAKLEAEPL